MRAHDVVGTVLAILGAVVILTALAVLATTMRHGISSARREGFSRVDAGFVLFLVGAVLIAVGSGVS